MIPSFTFTTSVSMFTSKGSGSTSTLVTRLNNILRLTPRAAIPRSLSTASVTLNQNPLVSLTSYDASISATWEPLPGTATVRITIPIRVGVSGSLPAGAVTTPASINIFNGNAVSDTVVFHSVPSSPVGNIGGALFRTILWSAEVPNTGSYTGTSGSANTLRVQFFDGAPASAANLTLSASVVSNPGGRVGTVTPVLS